MCHPNVAKGARVFLLAIVLACNERSQIELRGPLQLHLDIQEQRTFRRQDLMNFRITLTNQSEQPLLLCGENWITPKGIVRLRAFDSRGNPVKLIEKLHADFFVTDYDLVELKPNGSVGGFLRLDRDRTFAFTNGRYAIQAEYGCAMEGVRLTRGRHVRIEGRQILSNRVWIDIED